MDKKESKLLLDKAKQEVEELIGCER